MDFSSRREDGKDETQERLRKRKKPDSRGCGWAVTFLAFAYARAKEKVQSHVQYAVRVKPLKQPPIILTDMDRPHHQSMRSPLLHSLLAK